ncbi:hypothetical protein [Streptomyces altiplanensis]
MRKRFTLVGAGALGAAAVAVGIWLIWFRLPYGPADSPPVDVTVRAEKSEYQDVAETAEDVDTLVRVYVQRLKAEDAEGLAQLAGPDYDRPGPEARGLVREYGAGARGHVEATVLESDVPYFNQVELVYQKTGKRQKLLLVRDERNWWIAIGEGDPAAGLEAR